MTPPEPVPTAQLLAESAWLQRLALRLVREPADAADATQETFTKALARAPGAGVPLRAWLGAILRNVVRQGQRTDGRRRRREGEHDSGVRGAEPTDELAARLELHAHLVAAVRALEEPYRTTVALRFLEDLAPPAVAARMGVPLKTVHTRLERALARLRAQLDRGYGRREAWAALLVPHLGLPPALRPAPTPLAPLVAMGTLWKWSVAAAALTALGILALRRPPSPAEPAPVAHGSEPAAPSTPLERVETGVVLEEPRGSEREAAPVATRRDPAPEAPEPPAAPTLIGFVRDVGQRPVAGLSVTYERLPTTLRAPEPADVPAALAESAADGRFELPLPARLCRIVAEGRGYATLAAPTLTDIATPETPVVYVGPARTYSGRVVDGAGTPLPGADLWLQLADALAQELQPGTFSATLPVARTTSAADGSFAFPTLGGAPGSLLWAQADGHASASLTLPEESSDELVVTLARAARDAALAGRVWRADGLPAAGAYVSAGEASARCDGEGAFELEDEALPTRLRAVLPGHLPGELDLAGLPADERRELELVLGPAALRIAGRVEDAQGRALAGAQVWTTDGERFGEIPTRVGELTLLLDFDLEGVIDGAEAQAGGREATSDGAGRFELTGLVDRSY
ncbi:MAG TPA: sigma-70 family RNA polymerase sigma factor, partial [Planctomycetota bacterium]